MGLCAACQSLRVVSVVRKRTAQSVFREYAKHGGIHLLAMVVLTASVSGHIFFLSFCSFLLII